MKTFFFNMESFKFIYLESCTTLGITPSEKLISVFEEHTNSNSLNLSGIQVSEEDCLVLGNALSKDVHLKEFNCSNCLFTDEGLKSILWGIEKNKFLLTLNLKGNNIRSIGTESIGKLFRHNNNIQNLCLEWNGCGIFPEKFNILCEGLSNNNSIKTLDLRENQLNDICAQALSNVLLRNITLQKLDLRWNNIGLNGGRALLKALTKNKSIISLDISGNNVPRDILNAIEISTVASAERYFTNNEQIARTKTLASKLQKIEEEKNLQLKSLMEVLEKKDKDSFNSERWSSSKINELQEVLVEKVEIIEKLSTKVKDLEILMSITIKERDDFAVNLTKMENIKKELLSDHQTVLSEERKSKEEIKNNLLNQLASVEEENVSLKLQVKELSNMKMKCEEKISKFQTTITNLESQLKVDNDTYGEQLSSVNEKHAVKLREATMLHQKEVSRISEEYSDIEKNFQQKILLLEKQKTDLSEENKKQTAQIVSEKALFEESLHLFEEKSKYEKEKLKSQMEERIQVLEKANKKQEDILQEHLETIYELKTRITALDLSLAEDSHRIQYLQQCLDGKDSEKEAAVQKAKLEFKEQLEELHKLRIHIEEVNQSNHSLKEEMQDIKTIHLQELESKNKIIEDLKLQIEEKKKEISNLQEEECKRISLLQSAFETFLKESKKDYPNTEESGDKL